MKGLRSSKNKILPQKMMDEEPDPQLLSMYSSVREDNVSPILLKKIEGEFGIDIFDMKNTILEDSKILNFNSFEKKFRILIYKSLLELGSAIIK